MTIRSEARNALDYLRPLAVFAAATLVFLSVARAAFVLWHLDRVRAADMLGTVFVQGLRFDLVLVGFLTLIPVLLLWLFATTRPMLRVGSWLLRAYLVACFAGLVFMELATPSFINQYDARPNRLFVEYLIYPKEVVSTLVGGYAWQFAGAILAVIALAWLFAQRLRASAQHAARPMHFAAVLVLTPVLFALCVLAARSTLDHRAVNAFWRTRVKGWCESLVSVIRVVQPGTLRNGPSHARPYRTQPVSGLHHFVGHEIAVVLDVRPKPPIRRLNERRNDSRVRQIRGIDGQVEAEPVPVRCHQGVEHRLVGRAGARNLQAEIKLAAAQMIACLFQLNQHHFFAMITLHHVTRDLHQGTLRRRRPASVF